MTKFYVDALGAYLGGFDGAEPPEGAIEVGFPPAHGSDRWNGTAWASIPTVAEYTAAIQAMLDTKARERNYDGILSACTYATSTVPRFQAEGQACVAWRDAVWSTAYDLMAQVEAGQLAQPTLAGLLALLPPMAWPA
jgi:hypothetical protein